MTPLTYSLTETATRVGCSERFLRSLVGSRRIPCTRVGRLYRFTDAQVDAILAHLEQPAHSEEPTLLGARSRGARRSA